MKILEWFACFTLLKVIEFELSRENLSPFPPQIVFLSFVSGALLWLTISKQRRWTLTTWLSGYDLLLFTTQWVCTAMTTSRIKP